MALSSTTNFLSALATPADITRTLKSKEFKSEDDRANHLIRLIKTIGLDRANDSQGRSPMMLAAKYGRIECMQKLHEEFGATHTDLINLAEEFTGARYEFPESDCGHYKHLDPLINAQGNSGKFALTYAIQADQLEAAIFLCQHDAYINKWNILSPSVSEGTHLSNLTVPKKGLHSKSPNFSIHRLSKAANLTTMGYALSSGKLSYIALLLEHQGDVRFHLKELELLLKENIDHPLYTYCNDHLVKKLEDKNYRVETRSGSLEQFYKLIRAAHRYELEKVKKTVVETQKKLDEKVASKNPALTINISNEEKTIPVLAETSPTSAVIKPDEVKTVQVSPKSTADRPINLKTVNASPKRISPTKPRTPRSSLATVPENAVITIATPLIPVFVDEQTKATVRLLIQFYLQRSKQVESETVYNSVQRNFVAAVS